MEVVPEGIFVWKIDEFNQNTKGNRRSPSFKIGKYNCFLGIAQNNGMCGLCNFSCAFFLKIDFGTSLPYKMFCKFCLINSRGQEYLVTKRVQLLNSISFMYLMTIGYDEMLLENNDLLSDGALTLRLTWGKAKNKNDFNKGSQMTPDNNSGMNPIQLVKKLSEDFRDFYESKTLTDCVLKVGDHKFPVHRAILSARSPVFAAMFNHDTSENRSGEVVISDGDAIVLSNVLLYVYSGQVHGLSADNAAPMYINADKYLFIELKDVCLEFLMCNLTIENVGDAAFVAHYYDESSLEKEVIYFIKENSESLIENENWKEFSNTNPALAIKYLLFALNARTKWKPKKWL